MIPIVRAIFSSRGRAFSFSESSIWKSCIPPTFKKGITDIAIKIIPMPPSHWRIARQSKMPGGAWSSPVMTVEPVVVMPDTASKTESVRLIFRSDIRKGRAAKAARTIQLAPVRRNAWRTVISKLKPVLVTMSAPPKNSVNIAQKKKTFQSGFPLPRSTSSGSTILMASVESKIPIT